MSLRYARSFVYLVFGPSAFFWADGKAGGPAEVTFTDVTPPAAIRFTHVRGDSGKKYMVETLGSGAAFFDYDMDGLLDVYLVNGAALTGSLPSPVPTNLLFRNKGDGTFTDVTVEAGVGDKGYGMGAAVADYDNDGDLDLYVTNFGSDVFFRNNGDGTFTDATLAAGLGCERWGVSAAFGDIDADGYLDLYVANYVDFSLANHKICGNPATGLQDYCHPDVYNGLADVLYRNNADGSFTDVSGPAGVYTSEGKGLGVVFGDYDNDGDQDIFVANDSVHNFLWRNRGSGQFEERGLLAGVAFNEEGLPEGCMGVDFGDYDNDGWLDLFVTNLDFETNTLYKNQGGGFFTDATHASGMSQPSFFRVGFGTAFFDFDNDGDLDVFVANGHILETVDLVEDDIFYEQPNLLLRNDGRDKFEDVSAESGAHFATRRSSRGAAFGDYDNDGDLDVLVTNSGAEPNLLRNDGGSESRKILLRMVGTESNRDGIGARVVLISQGNRQIREVHGSYSYASHNDLRAHFGLGGSPAAELIEVRWPSGRVESFPDVPADRCVLLKEGQGILQMVELTPSLPGK